MNRRKCLHGLEFHNHMLLDEEIEPEGFLEVHAIVIERYGLLALHPKPLSMQVPEQDGLVYGFQQAGTEFSVDSEGGTDDGCRDRVKIRSTHQRDSGRGEKEAPAPEARDEFLRMAGELGETTAKWRILMANLLPPKVFRE